jgi:hypothetical protein
MKCWTASIPSSGRCTEAKRADLLTQGAPDGLYAEALRASRAADDPEVAEIAARLRAAAFQLLLRPDAVCGEVRARSPAALAGAAGK